MQLISAQTLTSASASVVFSSIPQTFTDLKVVYSARNTDSQAALYIRPNGSTSNLSARRLMADGTTVSSGTSGSTIYVFSLNDSTTTSNSYSNTEFYIPNYASTTVAKSISIDGTSETNASPGAGAFRYLGAGLWNDTTAISSITLVPEGTGIFAIGSSFYLYGISSDTANQNTSGPYAFGGDTITTDGTYWYHTFLNSNSFTPQKNLSVDYLVVAGGGGGGAKNNSVCGGGGAGGLRCTVTATGGGGSLESKLSLTAGTVYAAVVGAGGVCGSSNGSNSVFATITSTGGGLGGSSGAGVTGGSGGGSGEDQLGGGSGTANQGYAGGQGNGGAGGVYSGGGGGGANAVGASGGTSGGGNGGNGVTTSISGSSVTYAGGGGGAVYTTGSAGTGGTGGGGNGGAGTGAGTAGTANTGGGGGAGTNNTSRSANGGSGIIIVRYAV